ncbi:MAG: hypothetical protein ACD_57C00047G0002 [uncultured bacterium]|nr:MAG: hypothetical protein ACD_57C00047G0002 [uncultured bacterium]
MNFKGVILFLASLEKFLATQANTRDGESITSLVNLTYQFSLGKVRTPWTRLCPKTTIVS